MKIIDCIQGSPEWFAARCGIPTASDFDKIIDANGKQSRGRQKYMYRLAGERVAGKPEDSYQNGAMLRGTIMEAEARAFYELISDVKVETVGFCSVGKYGASPDGLVHEGAIEIKCPSIAVHVSYLIDRKLPTDYFQQVQGGLLVTGQKWCDFVSYYPGLNPLVVRVVPDEAYQKILKSELELFCEQLDDVASKLR